MSSGEESGGSGSGMRDKEGICERCGDLKLHAKDKLCRKCDELIRRWKRDQRMQAYDKKHKLGAYYE